MKEKPGGIAAVTIIYYSFSAQTASLVKAMAHGLETGGIRVEKIRLVPRQILRFPLRSILRTFRMMLTTFLRRRITIAAPKEMRQNPDLIILAGPTWSYNPSGPVLYFLDRYGRQYLGGMAVLPLISCRGYWRLHAAGLKRMLRRCAAEPLTPLVFTHPNPEPWRTIGVFLKIAGRTPEKSPLLKRHYSRFGHSHEQIIRAEEYGRVLARSLAAGTEIKAACGELAALVKVERDRFHQNSPPKGQTTG